MDLCQPCLRLPTLLLRHCLFNKLLNISAEIFILLFVLLSYYFIGNNKINISDDLSSSLYQMQMFAPRLIVCLFNT